MIGRKGAEAAIRVGTDGAEWLVWRMSDETLLSGRMTASYSVDSALDQWLGRAARFGLKPRRVWLVAGAASCAHRRIQIPGTDPQVVEKALPFAVQEELPLPLDQMWWTHSTQPEPSGVTTVDVVATPRSLFAELEGVLRERRLEIAGRIPEGPLLWHELAAIRGSEIDLLTVWGERRFTAIRGTETGMSSLLAFVRGPGESWQALVPDLRRPFQVVEEGKTILSIFASDRLRKRVLSLEDLIPPTSENRLNREIFHGVPEEVSVAASLLAVRRLRIEKRRPAMTFGDVEVVRAAEELRKVARSLEVPYQSIGVAALAVLSLALWWASATIDSRYAELCRESIFPLRDKQELIENQVNALKDLKKVRTDWGSVWLQLSQQMPETTLLKTLSYGAGSGEVRISGNTNDLANLEQLSAILEKTGFLKNIRVPKTEPVEKKLSFQVFTEFDSSKVKKYEVTDPYLVPAGVEAEKKPKEEVAGQEAQATSQEKESGNLRRKTKS